tara:strand:- start:490 stop:693 length:204 start_codon:yes stop_codon:yes gene_type:complete
LVDELIKLELIRQKESTNIIAVEFGSLKDQLLNEEVLDTFDDARIKRTFWRHDYNHITLISGQPNAN